MPSQEIYKDRKKFAKAVFEVSSSDLVNMGISIVSYTIKDISDSEVCLPLVKFLLTVILMLIQHYLLHDYNGNTMIYKVTWQELPQ